MRALGLSRGILTGAAVLLALVAAPGTSRAAEPIRIGELNSYKAQPAFLEPYRKGMELAIEEVNAAGGVHGRPLEHIKRADGGKDRQAQPATAGHGKVGQLADKIKAAGVARNRLGKHLAHEVGKRDALP